MIPNSIAAVLLFLVGVGPGYVFVRVAERREPRQARSPLLEFAELFVVGAASTMICALVVLLAASWSGAVSLSTWLAEGHVYVVRHVPALAAAGLLIVIASYALAWGLARFIFRGLPASVRPEYSVWFQIFHPINPRDLRFATVELNDGRLVAGYVHAYTVDDDASSRELALRAPIFTSTGPDGARTVTNDDFLILGADEIRYIGVQVG